MTEQTNFGAADGPPASRSKIGNGPPQTLVVRHHSNERAVHVMVEIVAPSQLKSAVLRERATQRKKPNSRQFIALDNGAEAGYISFDHRADIGTGIVYDLLVLPEYRQRGIGKRLLAFGEDVAASLNCYQVRLNPTAFDGSVFQQWLESWYSRRGYVWATDETREMEKLFGIGVSHDV